MEDSLFPVYVVAGHGAIGGPAARPKPGLYLGFGLDYS
jgi:hypothetical protein